MDIRAELARTLLFNAYRHYELVRTDGRLRQGELEDFWRAGGLRVSDLETTLEALVRQGDLRLEMTVAGKAYFLTDTGVRHIQSTPETPEMRRALFQIARRPRSGNGLRPDRRAKRTPS